MYEYLYLYFFVGGGGGVSKEGGYLDTDMMIGAVSI